MFLIGEEKNKSNILVNLKFVSGTGTESKCKEGLGSADLYQMYQIRQTDWHFTDGLPESD